MLVSYTPLAPWGLNEHGLVVLESVAACAPGFPFLRVKPELFTQKLWGRSELVSHARDQSYA